jgi:hypothetical protein
VPVRKKVTQTNLKELIKKKKGRAQHKLVEIKIAVE